MSNFLSVNCQAFLNLFRKKDIFYPHQLKQECNRFFLCSIDFVLFVITLHSACYHVTEKI